MRVRAHRFRAYSSKITARVLKTQLEVACKLYNTLLHAEKEEYEKNKRTMSMNELRQLALDEKAEHGVSGATLPGCAAGCREVLPSA